MKYALSALCLIFLFANCSKSNDANNSTPTICPAVCDVSGTYIGSATASTGITTTETYKLQNNDFAIGSVTPTGPIIAFGGYSNTCDSVYLRSWYTANNNYYIHMGKFINSNKDTLKGNYQNLTNTSDYGTFTLVKQNTTTSYIPTTCPPNCDVRGTYSGSATASTGVSTTETYKLQNNDFTIGSLTPTGPVISFGGYSNTCDSVYIRSWYNANSNYYLHMGKFINSNKDTLKGSYQNLTNTADYGTFTLIKQ